MFDSSVGDNRSDDTVYDALVESYEKLRGNFLRNGILETKPKREPIVEYIPFVQEICQSLVGLLEAPEDVREKFLGVRPYACGLETRGEALHYSF